MELIHFMKCDAIIMNSKVKFSQNFLSIYLQSSLILILFVLLHKFYNFQELPLDLGVSIEVICLQLLIVFLNFEFQLIKDTEVLQPSYLSSLSVVFISDGIGSLEDLLERSREGCGIFLGFQIIHVLSVGFREFVDDEDR